MLRLVILIFFEVISFLNVVLMIYILYDMYALKLEKEKTRYSNKQNRLVSSFVDVLHFILFVFCTCVGLYAMNVQNYTFLHLYVTEWV